MGCFSWSLKSSQWAFLVSGHLSSLQRLKTLSFLWPHHPSGASWSSNSRQWSGNAESEGSTPASLKLWSGNGLSHVLSHPIGQYLVTWPHLTAKEAGKWSPAVGSRTRAGGFSMKCLQPQPQIVLWFLNCFDKAVGRMWIKISNRDKRVAGFAIVCGEGHLNLASRWEICGAPGWLSW